MVERIQTGDTWWDEKLFVTKTEEAASQYGPDIETIVFKPDSKILREGTAEFVGIAGGGVRGNQCLILPDVLPRQPRMPVMTLFILSVRLI
jgi:hypothetical protein